MSISYRTCTSWFRSGLAPRWVAFASFKSIVVFTGYRKKSVFFLQLTISSFLFLSWSKWKVYLVKGNGCLCNRESSTITENSIVRRRNLLLPLNFLIYYCFRRGLSLWSLRAGSLKFVSRENIIRVLIEEMGGSPNQIKTTSTLGAVLYCLGTFGFIIVFLGTPWRVPGYPF